MKQPKPVRVDTEITNKIFEQLILIKNRITSEILTDKNWIICTSRSCSSESMYLIIYNLNSYSWEPFFSVRISNHMQLHGISYDIDINLNEFNEEIILKELLNKIQNVLR